MMLLNRWQVVTIMTRNELIDACASYLPETLYQELCKLKTVDEGYVNYQLSNDWSSPTHDDEYIRYQLGGD